MDNVGEHLIFTGKSDSKSVKTVLINTNVAPVIISFCVYPILNAKFRSINLFKIKDFSVNLTYGNRLRVLRNSHEEIIDCQLARGV